MHLPGVVEILFVRKQEPIDPIRGRHGRHLLGQTVGGLTLPIGIQLTKGLKSDVIAICVRNQLLPHSQIPDARVQQCVAIITQRMLQRRGARFAHSDMKGDLDHGNSCLW